MKPREKTTGQVGNEGLPLLEPLARRTDPETSRLAAALAKDVAHDQRQEILAYLLAHPEGATGDELDLALRWRPTTAGRRLGELLGRRKGEGVMGMVVRLDGCFVVHPQGWGCQLPAVTRPTRSHRAANVHIHRSHLDHWLKAT